jgi:hypothetical protein
MNEPSHVLRVVLSGVVAEAVFDYGFTGSKS